MTSNELTNRVKIFIIDLVLFTASFLFSKLDFKVVFKIQSVHVILVISHFCFHHDNTPV